MPKLLIIDDEHLIADALRPGFRNLNVEVLTANTAADGLKQVSEHHPDAILLDIGLPDKSGLEVLKEIFKMDSRIPTIVMTGQGTTATAIEAMKLGAFDYLHKPLTFFRTRDLIESALEVSRQMRTPVRWQDETSAEEADSDVMVGRCEAMREVYKMIGRISQQRATVLIRGDSGTGKELVARAIYQHSSRSKAPFLAINCAAIPESLIESELFGHERGAFTGADQRRIGKFEQCSGGTLFLDEIGDMSPLTQAKVLRVLQEQRFERVGGKETIQTDTRTIVATHRPLEEMVAEGKFREDLYYRLNVFTIHLPALRDRSGDLPELVNMFLRRFSGEMGREVREASTETLEILAKYQWPGNVRELQSVLRQALLHARGPVLLPSFLPQHIRENLDPSPARPTSAPVKTDDWNAFIDERLHADSQNLYTEWFTRMEHQLLMRVLSFTNGNQSRASQILGITRRSLRGKIQAHGIVMERSVSTSTDEDD